MTPYGADDRDGDDDLGTPDLGALDALDAVDEPPSPDSAGDDVPVPVVQVANSPGSIAVTAYMNGAVAQVHLDPAVTRMTEAELAQEITAVAGVAAKRATAVMHVVTVQMFVEQGMGLAEAREFVEDHMPFATPAEAEAAQYALSSRHTDQAD